MREATGSRSRRAGSNCSFFAAATRRLVEAVSHRLDDVGLGHRAGRVDRQDQLDGEDLVDPLVDRLLRIGDAGVVPDDGRRDAGCDRGAETVAGAARSVQARAAPSPIGGRGAGGGLAGAGPARAPADPARAARPTKSEPTMYGPRRAHRAALRISRGWPARQALKACAPVECEPRGRPACEPRCTRRDYFLTISKGRIISLAACSSTWQCHT